MYRLRTIDVWDTLLRRVCHPDLVKLATARHLLIAHVDLLKSEFRDHQILLRERNRVETELAARARAAGNDDEYTLEDALLGLLERVVIEESRIGSLVAELIEYEVVHEARHTYPDSNIREFLTAYPAERTVFLSDFYMSADIISRLLSTHGLADLVPEGVSSCDVMLNKRSGRLFDHVQELYGVSPDQHLHIGDNTWSDVECPRKRGIHSIHYLPEEEHRQREHRETLFPGRSALFSHIDRVAEEAAASQLGGLDNEAKGVFRLGMKAAPLFIGYALFIAETVARNPPTSLHFFTREGEFFIQVYRLFAEEARHAGYDCPQGDLLEISRLATFCASLQSVSTTEMMRLWNLYNTQSLFALSKTLGIDPLLVEPMAQRHGLTIEEKIMRPWKVEGVQRLFADQEFRTLLEDKISEDRMAALRYFASRGLTPDSGRVCVVDIGWRGTIQDNLALMLPSVEVIGLYLGLQRYLNPQPPNCIKLAFGPDVNHSHANAHLLDAITPIEMLTNSPSGSVVGYAIDADGTTRAIKAIDEGENAVYYSFVQYFQQGVLAAARTWTGFISSHAITSGELRNSGCSIWSDLVVRSPAQLAEAYRSLNHNEVFGVGGFVDKRLVPSPRQLIVSLFDPLQRQEVILYIRQTQWAAGLWKRDDLSFIHKCLLSSALTGGRIYKRILQRYRARTNRPVR